MGRTRTTVKVEAAPKRWLNKQEARLRNEALVSFSQFGSRMIWYDIASLDRFVLKNKVV